MGYSMLNQNEHFYLKIVNNYNFMCKEFFEKLLKGKLSAH